MARRTQQDLWREIKSSQDVRAVHRDGLPEEELAICGLDYGDGKAGGKDVPDDPENHKQTWLRQFHSANTLSSPTFLLEGQGQEWPPDRTGLLEQAVNRQAEQAGLKHTMHRCASDYALRQAQAVCYVRPAPGYEDEENAPWLCGVDRLAFDEYEFDPSVLDRSLGQWEAHRVSQPIEDVIHRAEKDKSLGWNLPALRDLEKQIDADCRKREKTNHKVERRDLVYWPMWWRNRKVDPAKKGRDGYFGSVDYVLDDAMPLSASITEPIRKSEDWFGHRSGPYAVGGAMWVGDLPTALSPLVGTGPQADWVNVVAKACMIAVANAKTLTGTTDAEAAEQIRNAVNGDVVHFANNVDIRTMVAQVASGGLDQQFIVAFQMALESLQRNAGTYQNRQGDVDSDATATAIMDAQAGYSAAMAFWSDGFRDFQRQMGVKWAFWTDLHPKMRVRVGPVPDDVRAALAQRIGGMPPAYFDVPGGVDRGSPWNAFDHELMDLRVSAFTGRQRNEQTLLQDFEFLIQAIGALAAFPPQVALSMDVQKYLRVACRARGNRDLERLIDGQLFQMLTGALLGAGETPKPQPQAQPRQITLGGGSGGGAGAGPRPTQTPASKPVQKAPAKPAMAGAAR